MANGVSAKTEYTARLIIVVRLALQQQGEAAAIAADPEAGAGTFIPGTPLRVAGDATNTVAALWSGWTMTQGQRSAFASNLGGPILSAGQTPNKNRDAWMFDAYGDNGWTGEQVLAALGFDTLALDPIDGYTPPPPNWP